MRINKYILVSILSTAVTFHASVVHAHVKILEADNIFVMDEARAAQQDIRTLKILVVNLMPVKW